MIITTDATGPAGDGHDRTPLILPRDRVDAWLDPFRTRPAQIYEVLDGIVPAGRLRSARFPAGSTAGTDGPDLIEPLSEDLDDEPLQLTMTARAA